MPERQTSGGTGVGGSLQSAVPVVLFVAVNRIGGLRWAVVVATLWSVWMVIDRRRRGVPLGVFMPVVTAAVIIRGAIGAITENETLYFGLGIATKFAVALVLALSVAIGRPLARVAAPYVLELTADVAAHRIFRSTMSIITSIGALYYLLSATFDVWLFRRSTVDGYVIIRFLANWPLSVAALAAVAGVASRLKRIPGVDSVTALVEARMARAQHHTPLPPQP